ncbi:MAG TPA: hypothetical protein VGQ19_13615 [Burkholderiales bacterium]|nr:hypothetical protein [Burkholderiales bacterium]
MNRTEPEQLDMACSRHETNAAKNDRKSFLWLTLVLVLGFIAFPTPGRAQSPELSMREFSSGQVKKGVRSIGFGGDGATWGNYGLVWKDAGTALVDYGDTHYTNGNDFSFSAVGLTSPSLWNDLTIYMIALSEGTNDVHFNTKSPGLGPSPVAVTGSGKDDALFTKIAMPLGQGLSAGVLLSYETSQFNAETDANPKQTIRYETEWRPSGGFGLAWQPNNMVLVGFRALLNTDHERRIDPSGESDGTARTREYRAGVSVSTWDGALLDIGQTRLEKKNSLAGTHTIAYEPNLGFEQALLNRRLVLRFGRDETSFTTGVSYKFAPFNLDVAYVNNMAQSRVGDLFGTSSRSFIATLNVDYRALMANP